MVAYTLDPTVSNSVPLESPAGLSYEFGPFRLDVQHAQLLRDGEPIALSPKVVFFKGFKEGAQDAPFHSGDPFIIDRVTFFQRVQTREKPILSRNSLSPCRLLKFGRLFNIHIHGIEIEATIW